MDQSSVQAEFETVDLLLASSAETRAVDAFALAWIKAERQVRKLFTYLIYQFRSYGPDDVAALRATLAGSRAVYFEGFLRAIDVLYPKSLEVLVGVEYVIRRKQLEEVIGYRNKVLHGQITLRSLSRDDLYEIVGVIRRWCDLLAIAAAREFGYDGFARNSFRKLPSRDLSQHYRVQLRSIDDYAVFVRTHLERARRA